MLKSAVLIDAGFLKRKLGTRDNPLTAKAVNQFIERLSDHESLSELTLHRIYFYDAPPLDTVKQKPLGGEPMDFGKTSMAKVNRRLHRELQISPFVALRMGVVQFRGWTLKAGLLEQKGEGEASLSADEIVPNVQQKGVDMRIGLDIASLTLKQHVLVIVLVTGDSDFIPAMKFARREGAQLLLVTLGHKVTSGMREHSDMILSMANT